MNLKLVIISIFFLISCSSNNNDATETELFLMTKFHAEDVNLGYITTNSINTSTGKEKLKYISVQIINPHDIESLMENDDHAENKGYKIAQYILDSLNIDKLEIIPEFVEIQFVKEKGFTIFNITNQKNVKYYLEKE